MPAHQQSAIFLWWRLSFSFAFLYDLTLMPVFSHAS